MAGQGFAYDGQNTSSNSCDGKRAVLATISSDAHGWNLVYLQLLLEEEGHRVANLGPCTEIPAVLEAARAAGTRIVVLSTVNGHGEIEAPHYARALRARFPDLRIVIGGKLTTDGDLDPRRGDALLEAGFDAVFTGADAADRFRTYLRTREQAPARERAGAAAPAR